MCSCMPAFAGFFRYHRPFFRSIKSFFSTIAKGLGFLKLSSQSSSSTKSKRLATKDIEMTLGSQSDGRGHFMYPGSVLAADEDRMKSSQAAHNPPSLCRKPSGTRREWHEDMAELKRQSLGSHPPILGKPSTQTHV